MNWYTYDTEVFAHDFIVDFKNKSTGEHTTFHNDNLGVKEFINDEGIYCGFNTKEYDQYIIKAICGGLYPEEIKQVNDWIINGGQGWQCPLLNGIFFKFNNVDIRDDVYKGLSLKTIEGHLNMSIEETEVDFNLDRPLNAEELARTIKYCRHDVDATEKLTDIRGDYLKTKLNLGKRSGIEEIKALSATNAKLTAMLLGAERKEWNDGREYVYPSNLDLSVIPQPILDFFETIHDMSIPDKVLFKTDFKMELGGMPCKWAWGGVHGSLLGYYEEATETRVIQNRDVSSLYPSLIEIYNYISRNVPNPQLFFDIRKERIAAKHNGDKQLAKDLKLPLNTVSGAQENQYNDLYDPLPTRSMRISGQLFLTVLTVRLLNACKTIKLINLNTDGLAYSIDKSELPIADAICAEWEKETKFELEVDEISKIWVKDVNNLLIIKTDGKVKTVGGYLNYGVSVKGAWAINNTMIIVKKALVAYFTKGIPVEETIDNSTDIFDFQIIAKAGAKYKEAYHIVDGVAQPIQKVNRVYATADERYGKLYKVKAVDESTAQIESLPDHCVIDNDNQMSIDDIDREFYIEMARNRIKDFLGQRTKKNKKSSKQEESKMATTTTTKTTKTENVYQKLLAARALFLGSDAKKTGKNMTLAFKYFELDDIVPIVTKIFSDIGLISLVSFTAENAEMTICNTDNPEDCIKFTAPMVTSEVNKAVTPVQAFGATVTYYRRYLYMMAMDICEPDSIDPVGATQTSQPTAPVSAPTLSPAPKVNSIPLGQTESKSMTASSGNATDVQIKQLKEVLKQLKAKDPSQEEFIAKIAVETKGFTVISKADCEKIVIKVNEMLEGK